MFNHTLESSAPGSLLVRNLFTLTGTVQDHTLLGNRGRWKEWPALCGYSSVGVVQKAGRDCPLPDEEAMLLMPSCYQKYLSLDKTEWPSRQKSFLQRLPKDIDGVDAAFIPILSLAIDIYNRMELMPGDPIVFSGCGLLGAILLKLMKVHTVPVMICLEETDLERDLLLKNGAEAVFRFGETIPGNLSGISTTVVVLSGSESCFNMSQQLLAENGIMITDAISGKGSRYFWLSRDLVHEAIGLLAHEEINLKDLISCHLHLEAIQEMTAETRNRLFRNKIIVFDW